MGASDINTELLRALRALFASADAIQPEEVEAIIARAEGNAPKLVHRIETGADGPRLVIGCGQCGKETVNPEIAEIGCERYYALDHLDDDGDLYLTENTGGVSDGDGYRICCWECGQQYELPDGVNIADFV